MATEDVLAREAVDARLKWRLEDLYPDPAAWQAATSAGTPSGADAPLIIRYSEREGARCGVPSSSTEADPSNPLRGS